MHFNTNNKCEIYVEAKLIKIAFHSIKRNMTLLELVYSNSCDSKFVQIRSGKKYFITFIDDCTRYCYACQLKSKDETLEVSKCYKIVVENQLGKRIKIICSE